MTSEGSLRELLHDEPALIRGAVGSVEGESHGGKFAVYRLAGWYAGFYGRRASSPLAPVVGHVAGAGGGVCWGSMVGEPLHLGARGRPRGGGGG